MVECSQRKNGVRWPAIISKINSKQLKPFLNSYNLLSYATDLIINLHKYNDFIFQTDTNKFCWCTSRAATLYCRRPMYLLVNIVSRHYVITYTMS